jgi:hypothetical protein
MLISFKRQTQIHPDLSNSYGPEEPAQVELCSLIDWLIDLGSSPYVPDGPRPYRRGLCVP